MLFCLYILAIVFSFTMPSYYYKSIINLKTGCVNEKNTRISSAFAVPKKINHILYIRRIFSINMFVYFGIQIKIRRYIFFSIFINYRKLILNII